MRRLCSCCPYIVSAGTGISSPNRLFSCFTAQVLDDMQNGMLAIEVETSEASKGGKADVLSEATLSHEFRRSKTSQTAADSRTVSHSVWKRTSQSKTADMQATTAPNIRPDTHPYPKWPPGHQSGAFDAVAVKRSYILSPPEIYAECAHHGEASCAYHSRNHSPSTLSPAVLPSLHV